MLGRVATYVVPSVAVAVTAFVLLGPGSRRPAYGVRVRGVPVEASHAVSLRLEGVRRLYGIDDAAALEGVRIEARSSGGELGSWEGLLGSDGIAEARLEGEHGARGWLELRVTRGNALLAEGRTALRAPTPLTWDAARISGTASGALAIRAGALRGRMAAPFWDTVRVEIEPAHPGARSPTSVELEAPGAELAASHVDAREESGRMVADVRVSPRAHTVELTVKARDAEGHEGRWEGYLPVLPGAMWLDPDRRDALVIKAPSPRPRAYVSIEGPEGRLFGAVVTLAQDATGFPTGSIAVSDVPGLAAAGPDAHLFAVVAGDPFEQGAGAIAWPISGSGRVVAPPLELLLDGLPAAEARESARARDARRVGIGLIGIAALATILLVILGGRTSQASFEAHLGRAFEEGEEAPVPKEDQARLMTAARASPVLRIAVFAALIALAFALVAAASTFR